MILFLGVCRAVFLFYFIFYILISFSKICAFNSLEILLISAIVRAYVSYSSRGFFVGFLRPRYSSFWFSSFKRSVYKAALSSCIGDT